MQTTGDGVTNYQSLNDVASKTSLSSTENRPDTRGAHYISDAPVIRHSIRNHFFKPNILARRTSNTRSYKVLILPDNTLCICASSQPRIDTLPYP